MLIHEEGGDALIRVGNPCPIVERNGKIVHLLFTRGGGECLFYTKSTDDGRTWSKLVVASDVPGQKEYSKTSFLKDFGGSPVKIGAGPVHGIQTKKGRLIAPSYVGRTVDSKRRGQSCIIYSDDGGETWKAGGIIPFVPEFRHGECTVVERRDGTLLMNMRSGAPGAYALGYRVVSTSSDGGATWSKPVLDSQPLYGAHGGAVSRRGEVTLGSPLRGDDALAVGRIRGGIDPTHCLTKYYLTFLSMNATY